MADGRVDAFPVEVIPVLDLKQGRAVRGIGGRRALYRPIESALAPGASPVELAKSLAKLGFRSLYVADLDAIGGASPNWQVLSDLAAIGLDLCIDAGVRDLAGAESLAACSPNGRPIRVIAGLETLPDLGLLGELVRRIGAERLIFSLDLLRGRPILGPRAVGGAGALAKPVAHEAAPVAHEAVPVAHETALKRASLDQALQIAEQAVQHGVRRIIVLDLAQIGSAAGAGDLTLERQIRDRWPKVELISGGGVRWRFDLHDFAAAGCRAVLVGSALYDGSLWRDDGHG